MNGGRSREASVRICGFGHDDFQYKLKLLEGVSLAVGECQGAEDKEAPLAGCTGERDRENLRKRGERGERTEKGEREREREGSAKGTKP